MPNPQFTDCQGGRAGRRREPVFHRDPAEDRRHGRGNGEGWRHLMMEERKNERMVRDSCLNEVNDWWVIESVPFLRKVKDEKDNIFLLLLY